MSSRAVTPQTLARYGIHQAADVVYNPSYELLFAEETRADLPPLERGTLTQLGAVNVATGEFTPNDEVDELVWLPLERVREHLTWDRDQELFDLVVTMPEVRAQAS